MKGYVDKSACIGCGMCVDTAPDAFRIGEDGLAEATRRFRQTKSMTQRKLPKIVP